VLCCLPCTYYHGSRSAHRAPQPQRTTQRPMRLLSWLVLTYELVPVVEGRFACNAALVRCGGHLRRAPIVSGGKPGATSACFQRDNQLICKNCRGNVSSACCSHTNSAYFWLREGRMDLGVQPRGSRPQRSRHANQRQGNVCDERLEHSKDRYQRVLGVAKACSFTSHSKLDASPS
jgi:hypothetical protein